MKQLSLTPELYQYMLDISVTEAPVLQALREETAKLPLAVMQISPLQAQFMQFLIGLLQAKKVLELGTFTGYSALAMAQALSEDGQLITCDHSEEWTRIAKPFWKQANQHHKIDLRLGKALDTLQQLEESGHRQSFDFIFIDADKTNYLAYYEHALTLVKKTGVIAIDNVLWGGKVIDEQETNGQVREIRQLNERLKNDHRVTTSLVPIADGLFLVQLKE